MFKTTVKYTNFDGKQVEKTLYFNLTKFEMIELQVKYGDNLDEYITEIANSGDNIAILNMFKDLVKMSYGVRVDDTFRKSEQDSEDFLHSEAFSELILSMMSDSAKAAEFVRGIVPNVPSPEI